METIKQIRVIQDFGSLTDDEVVSTGTAVVAGLTNNKHFTNLPYDLNQLQADVGNLTSAIGTAAHQGGRHATAAKNKLRRDVIAQLKRWALYVQGNSNNDLEAITSTGFAPGKHHTDIGSLAEGSHPVDRSRAFVSAPAHDPKNNQCEVL